MEALASLPLAAAPPNARATPPLLHRAATSARARAAPMSWCPMIPLGVAGPLPERGPGRHAKTRRPILASGPTGRRPHTLQ
eukprot:5579325-Prymnesium_polylepis.1